MKKFMKNLIIICMILCTISSVSFARRKPAVNINKGTVTGKGTQEEPYQLVMGEKIIDLLYTKENNQYIFFEFTSGTYNRAAYMLEHNPDKKRLRLELIGNADNYLNVVAEENVNYLQAGAKTHVDETISSDKLKIPYYNIESRELFGARRNDGINVVIEHSTDLWNSYIEDSSIKSDYNNIFVFSKSNLSHSTAYNLSDEQLDKAKISYVFHDADGEAEYSAYASFDGNGKIVEKPRWGTNSEESLEKSYTEFSSVKVVYQYKGLSSEATDAFGEKANFFESLITKVFTSIGDVFVKISGLGGFGGESCVTIDSLVFNEYPNTIVDFFGETGYTNSKAQGVIEIWFKIFKAWAVIIYIILLVYIGIKTVLFSGTSEQKKVKSMLESWLQGLLLLFFMPFLFKYLIVINDAFVDILRVNSKYSVHAYYTFENMYKDEAEDGEDSTTTVLARLQNAANDKKDKIQELTSSIEEKEKEYQDVAAELERFNTDIDQTKEDIERKLTIVANANERLGHEIRKNDEIVLTTEQLKGELWDLVEDFYSAYPDAKSFDDPNFLIELREIAEAYAKSIKIYDKETGKEAEYEKVHEDGTQYFTAAIRERIIDVIIGGEPITHTVLLPGGDELEVIDSLGSINALFDLQRKKEIYEKDLQTKSEEMEKEKQELINIEYAISMIENNDADIMGTMRKKAGDTGRFFYVVIWLFMLFEVIILLILYYKRLFMLMVLIAIFPLITIAYVYEKSKGGKSGILKNWIQEYIVNIFIQTFHAILYVTLVEVGYSVYIADNDNWVIFVIAVMALILVEPIFKHILGLKSSTVNDLAKYGASVVKTTAVASAIGSTVLNTKKDIENINKEYQNKEVKINKQHEKDDKRQDTLRQHRDNKINQNEKLTASEREAKLAKKHEQDEKEDKRKEWLRKQNAKKRVHQRRIKQYKQAVKNATGAMGTVAGGLAAGGQMDDFITAASVANALTGTGRKVDLSDDAKKQMEAEKSLENATTTNVPASENNFNLDNVNYSGEGYDDYEYNGTSGDSNSVGNEGLSVRNPKLAGKFAKRLEEEKIYVNKNINITYEDK